jgi:hypothetical protein
MEERIGFIMHDGRQILLIDFSQCSSEQILVLLEEVQRKVAANPKGSLLVLADFTGGHFDKAVVTRMKEVLVHDRPYVRRAAWVGTSSLPKVFYENAKSFSQRDLPSFETREEAMAWLVNEREA